MEWVSRTCVSSNKQADNYAIIFKLLDALDHMWINKEFLMGGKPVFIKDWDLLNSNGQRQFFQEFNNKYECNTKFLQCTKLPVQTQNILWSKQEIQIVSHCSHLLVTWVSLIVAHYYNWFAVFYTMREVIACSVESEEQTIEERAFPSSSSLSTLKE